MFKFATLMAGEQKQVHYIFDQNDLNIGIVGYDEEGIYVNLKNRLPLLDMITLLEQIEGGSINNSIKEVEINYSKH